MDILNETPEKMTFISSGSPVEPELRPVWRISLIIIILKNLCRGSSASLKKIQVLYSILSSSDKRDAYSKHSINAELNIRFDPLLDRAISIGLGEGLLELDEAKSIRLTRKGNQFSEKIYANKNIFELEKEFIESYTKSEFTDKNIDKLLYKGII
jgi:predicted transcriptional regulator